MARSNDIYEIPDTSPRLRIPRRQLNAYGWKKTSRATLRVFEVPTTQKKTTEDARTQGLRTQRD